MELPPSSVQIVLEMMLPIELPGSTGKAREHIEREKRGKRRESSEREREREQHLEAHVVDMEREVSLHALHSSVLWCGG